MFLALIGEMRELYDFDRVERQSRAAQPLQIINLPIPAWQAHFVDSVFASSGSIHRCGVISRRPLSIAPPILLTEMARMPT